MINWKLDAAIANVKADLLARESDVDLFLIEALSDLMQLLDTLHEAEPNKFLFGKNLTENLKQVNILSKETQILLLCSWKMSILRSLLQYESSKT